MLRQPWFDGDVQSAIDDVLVVVNEIGCAPSRYVDRTCRIEFTLVRKDRPRLDIAERKRVGWRALEWRGMLDVGVYRNQSELARGEGVSTAAVSIALRKLDERSGDDCGRPAARV